MGSNEEKKDNLNKKEEEPVNSKIDIALESLSKEECKEGKILEEEKQSSDSNIANTMINDSLKTDKIITSKEMPSQDVIISSTDDKIPLGKDQEKKTNKEAFSSEQKQQDQNIVDTNESKKPTCDITNKEEGTTIEPILKVTDDEMTPDKSQNEKSITEEVPLKQEEVKAVLDKEISEITKDKDPVLKDSSEKDSISTKQERPDTNKKSSKQTESVESKQNGHSLSAEDHSSILKEVGEPVSPPKNQNEESETVKEALLEKEMQSSGKNSSDICEKEIVSPKKIEVVSFISDDLLVIKPGLLKLTVFEASELINKDIIGKSDPFVKIKFDGLEFKSKKVRNCLNPEWNFSVEIIVKSSNEKKDIVIEIYDDDFGAENFIGSYTLSLNQAILNADKEATWHDLTGCKTGKVSLSTVYTPDEETEIKARKDLKEDDNSSSKEKNDGESDEVNKDTNKDCDKKDESKFSGDKDRKTPMKEDDKTDIVDVLSKDKKEVDTVKLEKGENEHDNSGEDKDSYTVPDMVVKNEQQLNTNEDDLSKGTASALEKTNEIFKSKDEIISSDPKKEEIENIRAGALGLKDVMNQKKESLKDDKKENSELSAVPVDKSKD